MIRRLDDWLHAQADRRPDACAAVFHDRRISYSDLERGSNRLAEALVAAGCRREDRVALLLPKSVEALTGMFGAMKAGCIYVPMDVSSPVARQKRILEQCGCSALLAVESTAPLLDGLAAAGAVPPGTRIGWLDRAPANRASAASGSEFDWDEVRRLPDRSPDRDGDPPPAHILFTSGSTGVPKGVIITHANIIHFVNWAIGYFGIDASDRLSCHSPLHFDLSMFDIYGAVAAGAEVHLLSPELSLLPHRLAAYIRDARLTQWFSVPSVLSQMARFDAVRHDDFPGLRRLLWCGEKLPTPALIHWMKRLPHVAFDNLYGPTETTIASSFYRVPKCPEKETEEIPIGSPCAGEQLWVLDDNRKPLPAGEIGELYISGIGLSPGYWRDPEKTAQTFLTAAPEFGGRLYKTGDLARVGSGGLVYLLGRVDTQIKSRGYRIELGEVESALYAVCEVESAAVVALDAGGFEGSTICCAYVPRDHSPVAPAELRKRLAGVLPGYMLPAAWLALDAMPLNGNGKADRPRIRELFLERAVPARAI